MIFIGLFRTGQAGRQAPMLQIPSAHYVKPMLIYVNESELGGRASETPSASMAAVTRRSLSSFLSRTLRSPLSHFPRPSRLPAPVLSPEVRRLAGVVPQLLLSRWKTTSGSGYSPLNDPSPNWSNRPPKETILLDGCDYEHWLIVMEFPQDPKTSEEEMIAAYVKTLADVVGRFEKSYFP